MKVTRLDEQQARVSVNQVGDSATQQRQEILTQTQEASTPSPGASVMVYRGAKYRRSPDAKESSPTVTQGKYRGQPWSR
ncbi:MAG: hypothetical protein HC827_06940 [Cyanobacteria bacterium RM1_2_2]|nr:hypothetical protein [Cyanobacteria bacterium RM1_2_2]